MPIMNSDTPCGPADAVDDVVVKIEQRGNRIGGLAFRSLDRIASLLQVYSPVQVQVLFTEHSSPGLVISTERPP